MSPVKTAFTTNELGRPADWNDQEHGPCESLPVAWVHGVFYSSWRPTWKERLAILFGRQVRLSLVGSAHPPVMLDTE